jgi:hypothetical protein
MRLHLGDAAPIGAGYRRHNRTFRRNGDRLRNPRSQDYRPPLLTSPVSMMPPPLISQFNAEQPLQLKAAK